MSTFQYWLIAIHPQTLSISLSPVLAGCTLAWSDQGQIDWFIALATLSAALLIQAGTNLYNDAGDFERGTDKPGRAGPPRAAAEGWLSVGQIKQGALICFSLALVTGIFLTQTGGWPILLLGLTSITAGYAYTGGPRPIAYSASGEVFVFLFFGLAAVTGTYYLQTDHISGHALFTGAALGLLAAAVLLVNNIRDKEEDRLAGKLTLAYYLTPQQTTWVYGFILLLPFTIPLTTQGNAKWLVAIALPIAIRLVWRLNATKTGAEFNKILATTARLQLTYTLLLCIGMAL